MTPLNKEALEAAHVRYKEPTVGRALDNAIQAFIEHPAAGLVERSKLDYNEFHLTRTAEMKQERDEARRDVKELRADIARLVDIAAKETELAEERGAQIVALREALGAAKKTIRIWFDATRDGDPEWEFYECAAPPMKQINAALTDTADAAALYQRVDKEHVVVSTGSLQFLIDCLILGPLEFAAKYGPERRMEIPQDIETIFKAFATAPEPERHLTESEQQSMDRALRKSVEIVRPEAGEGTE